MTVFLQCAETQGPCYKNPNWDKCLCNGCVTYRRQLKSLRHGYVGEPLDPTKIAGLKAAQESLVCSTCGGHGYHLIDCSVNESLDTAKAAGLKAAQESLVKLNKPTPSVSDGSTAAYYELPLWARELADLIRYKKMNGSQAEMFRALYRGSEASHSDERRQAKKLLAYAVDEVVRTHFPEESFAFYRNGVFEAIFGKQE